MEYLALFFTQSGAIKYHRFLAQKRINCELKPAPRKLSSSCGIAARFRDDGDLRMLINTDVESIYQIDGDHYILRYQAQE